MLYIDLICFFILFVVGMNIDKNIFAPFNLVIFVWGIVITFYLLSSNLYPIINKFDLGILIWGLGFYVSSMFYSRNKSSMIKFPLHIRSKANAKIIQLYIIIALTSIPYIIYKTYTSILQSNPENIFLHLRMMNTGLDQNIEKPDLGLLPYIINLLLILYFILLAQKAPRRIIAVFFTLNIIMALLGMSKLTFAVLIISSTLILYTQKRISTKGFSVGIIAILFISIVIQVIRSETGVINISDFFTTYILSGMVAFDYYQPLVSLNYLGGDYVFRFFYAIMSSLGFDIYVADTILGYISIPYNTNVYTVLHPYYNDFGYWGVFVFALINGAIMGKLYKKRSSSTAYLILFSIFSVYIIFQFLGDFLIVNLSTTIQYILFTTIPFFKTTKND